MSASVEFYFLLVLTLPLLFASALFKGTILEIDFKSGALYSLIFYKTLVFVISAYLLIQYYGMNSFPLAFRIATDDMAFTSSLWVVYSLYALLISLAVSLRFLKIPMPWMSDSKILQNKNERNFVISAFATGSFLLVLSILFFGYRHAFIYSLLTGEHLLRVRLDNVYHSLLPSQFSYLFSLCSWILAIYAGRSSYYKKWGYLIVCFLASLTLASIGGGKAPLIDVLFMFALGRFSLKGLGGNLTKIAFYIVFGVIFSIFVFYWIVKVQVPDLTVDDYFIYLANRAGVGQMAGVYESFAVGGLAGDFFWHIIPFASIFIDYPIYDKELMVFVENVYHTDMGVKNSLFISEAYGIGGYVLVALSPFIVGFCYVLSLWVGFKWMIFLFERGVATVYSAPIFMMSMNITGNFSSFPLLKGCILNLIVISLLWPAYFFVTRFNSPKVVLKKRASISILS